jgi:hypothetical protein
MSFNKVWSATHVNDGYRIERSSAININNGKIYNNGHHGVSLGAGCKNIQILGNRCIANGVGSPGVYSGIHVDAGVSYFQIQGNLSTSEVDLLETARQKYGIEVATGASDHYSIVNNCVWGNAVAGVIDGGTGFIKEVSGNVI